MAIVLTVLATSIIFLTIRLLPGTPFSELIASSASLTPDQVDEMRAQYGLGQPIWIQYLKYLRNLMTLDFGHSIKASRPVWEVISPALVSTIVLLVPALVLTAIVSTVAGMYAGWNRGSFFEKSSIVVTVFFRATPIFVTGVLALLVFSYTLNLTPAFGMRSPVASPEGFVETYVSWDFLHHYILPFSIAVLYYSGDFLLLARNNIVERRGAEFLKLHKAKGLTEGEQLIRAGRNSLVPVVTYFALRLGMIFQGVVALEIVFAWPGIGRALVHAIHQKDYPTVQAAVFIMAVTVILLNLLADIVAARLDPTITAGAEETQ